MKLVQCSKCSKEINVLEKRYKRNITNNYKFFCSKECRITPIEERFWSKVNKTEDINDCWEWNASGRGQGYGALKYNGKILDAHRLSWILHHGEINNSKLFVCHKCDNRKCVNPNHLFLGTNSDNMKDAYNKGRLIVPIGKRFEIGNIPKSRKYTTEQIKEVLDYINNNLDRTIKSICEEFNIDYNTIRDARRSRNRTYSSLRLH